MPDNRTRRTIRRTSDYYIEGSAVRKLETLPEEYPSRPRRKTAEERRLEAERKRKREIARKNQERALRLNLTYTGFLIVSVFTPVSMFKTASLAMAVEPPKYELSSVWM